MGDRAVIPAEVTVFEKLKLRHELPVRVILTWRINAARPVEQVVSEIRASSWTTNKEPESDVRAPETREELRHALQSSA